jgi:hypothetical protein
MTRFNGYKYQEGLWVPREQEKRYMMPRRGMMACSGASAAYDAVSVRFDGTNDYLTSGADLSGAADGKKMIVSFWMNVKGGDGSERVFFRQAGNVTELKFTTGNKLQFDLNGSSTRIISTNTYVASGGWTHVYFSMDVNAGGGNYFSLYTNDTEVGYDTQAKDDSNKDFTFSLPFGATSGGGSKINCDIADVYINFAQDLNPGTTSNRRKFIDAAGKPVNLGTTGTLPTGNTPDVLLTNAVATWHENEGDGGQPYFTENGALTAGANSPSD